MIQIKRVYDEVNANEGYRLLVDRLWPRGLSKEDAKLDEWLKEIAPSNKLRKWFDHDRKKWNEFKEKYWLEVQKNTDVFEHLISIIDAHEKVTFLFAAQDYNFNNAAALKEYVEHKFL